MSKLEPFKPILKERLQVGVWNGQVLLRESKERNYNGGYTLLTDWLRPNGNRRGWLRFGDSRQHRASRRR